MSNEDPVSFAEAVREFRRAADLVRQARLAFDAACAAADDAARVRDDVAFPALQAARHRLALAHFKVMPALQAEEPVPSQHYREAAKP